MSPRFLKYGVSVLVGASLVSSCGLQSQMKDMRAATQDMKAQTDRLGQTTAELDQKTAEMYDALKQGDTLAARRSALRALLEARENPRKVSEAGKYFMSFEFQIWSALGQDSEDKRAEDAAGAAREFFRDVQDFVPQGTEGLPRPFAQGEPGVDETGNRVRCFNAMSVALHLVNPKQERVLRSRTELKPITMESMIRAALMARPQIDAGAKTVQDYPAYVREILVHEDLALHLLQARVNFLATMALARVSPLGQGPAQVARMVSGEWSAALAGLNTVELAEATGYLEAAVKTHEFLSSIGVRPRLDGALNRIFRNMKTPSAPAVAPETAGEAPAAAAAALKTRLESQFAALVDRFRAASQASEIIAPQLPPPPQAPQTPPVPPQAPATVQAPGAVSSPSGPRGASGTAPAPAPAAGAQPAGGGAVENPGAAGSSQTGAPGNGEVGGEGAGVERRANPPPASTGRTEKPEEPGRAAEATPSEEGFFSRNWRAFRGWVGSWDLF